MPRVQSYLTYHMQDPFPDWDVWLHLAHLNGFPFRSIKVFHPEDWPIVKAASPNTDVIYRSWADKSGQGRWMQMALEGKAEQAANEYIDSWIDSVRAYMPNGACESLNEEYPTGNLTKMHGIVEFDMAFIVAMARRLPNHRAVVFTAAVGNPGWNELDQLLPLAELAERHNAAFGYHGYHPVKDKVSGVELTSAKTHLHLRFDGIDGFLLSRGHTVDWFIGEAGAMGVQVLDPPPGDNWGMSVVNGWKSSVVWDGNLDSYISDLAHLDLGLANTRVAREGRLLGVSIFTSRPGDDPAWHKFNMIDEAARRLGNLIGNGVEVSDYLDPDPDPDPSDRDELHRAAWAITADKQVTGRGGLRLNAKAGIQQQINIDNELGPAVQIVTDEVVIEGVTFQAAESLTGACARRVYAWEAGQVIYYFNDPKAPLVEDPFVVLSQRDLQWVNQPIGYDTGHGKTIGNWGCLLVVYNMLAQYYGLTNQLPDEYNAHMVLVGGFSGPYLLSGAFGMAHPGEIVYEGFIIRASPAMLPKINDWINAGKPVPVRVDFKPATGEWEQHWVLLLEHRANNDYLIADPWTGQKTLLSASYGIPGIDVLEALFYQVR